MHKPDPILPSKTSHLFILHLWVDAQNPDQPLSIYGKIQQAPEGECLYFRQWAALILFLEDQMKQLEEGEE